MSENLPFMPWWVGDYLRDTMHLDTAMHGAYCLLLMHYWTNGPLPDDDTQLRTIARAEPKAWRVLGPVVRAFFTVTDGCLHQKRMDRERRKALDVSEKRRAAANARHGPCKQDANAYAHAPAFASRLHADSRARQPHPHPETSLRSVPPDRPSGDSAPPGRQAAPRKRRTGVGLGWQPDEAGRRFAAECGIANLAAEVPRFVEYHVARANLMADWGLAWRSWCRKAQEFAKRDGPKDERFERGINGAMAAAGLLGDSDE